MSVANKAGGLETCWGMVGHYLHYVLHAIVERNSSIVEWRRLTGHLHYLQFWWKVVKASVEASIASMEASMKTMEASMEARKLPRKQLQQNLPDESLHGSFHGSNFH